MLVYLSAILEWLPSAIAAALLVYFAHLKLEKRKEKLKVILDLETNPRTLEHLGAWAIVANLSSAPVWLQRFTFRAQELGMCGKPITLDVRRTINVGEDQRIECHESIYEAFEQIDPRHDLYVGYVDIAAEVQSNGDSAKPRRTYKLTSGRYGVNDVKEASSAERLWKRLKTKYLFWRLRRTPRAG